MASDQVDQLYLQAFDPLKYTISLKLRGKINRIRDNNEKLAKLILTAFDARGPFLPCHQEQNLQH